MKKITTALGKILKNLKFFDFLVLAVFVFCFVFLLIVLMRKERWIGVDFRVISNSGWENSLPPYWSADMLVRGEKQYDFLGRKVAEILDVKNYESNSKEKMVYLSSRLKVTYDNRTHKFSFNHEPLEIGKPVDLHFGAVGISGLVTYIEGVPDPRIWEEKIIEARLINDRENFLETQGEDPWKAEAIAVGDKMTDSNGNVLAEILEKKVFPADKIVVTNDGRAILTKDPLKKDVYLKIKIKTVRVNRVSYFLNDFKVKVGNSIPVYLSDVDVWPLITKIEN